MRIVLPVRDLVKYFHGYPKVSSKKMLRKRIETALFFEIQDRKERERISKVILEKLEKGDYEVVLWQQQ